MVKGIDRFRDHFRSFNDQYLLIGGTACDLLFDQAGLTFRATKDLDIVLIIEALDSDFVKSFWKFVQMGRYEHQEASTGERRFYRFYKPDEPDFPFMLELFSRTPHFLHDKPHGHLAPIPVGEDVSSLSAILLDDDYYAFLQTGRTVIDDLPIVTASHLIPLKARAWIDLSARRQAGEKIDSHDIAKHRNDVFRLYQILDLGVRTEIPATVQSDLWRFLDDVAASPVDLKALRVTGVSLDTILDQLREHYRRS